jgi:ligand-binding sensor domain-containing protein
MNRLLTGLIAWILCITIHAAEVGKWNAYMAYSNITEIEDAGDILYILASDNLYSYNTNDQSVQTYHKMNFLNDCSISHIAWSKSAKRLVIVYDNVNIDLLDQKNNVTNLSDYYIKSMTGDKTVNHLFVDGNYVYLSTGFGIIKLNVKNGEFSDTYNLGFNVDYSYIENNTIFAASKEKGLYAASLSSNLLDKSNWKRTGNYTRINKTVDPELLRKAANANPGGPKHNHFAYMTFRNGQLYTCGGGFGDMDLERDATVQVMKENEEWTIYEDSLKKKTGISFVDMFCLDVSPTDPNHVFAGCRSGLFEFKNGNFTQLHHTNNSPIKTAMDYKNPDYTLVEGVKYDKEGNLWCLNSQSEGVALLEYTKEGEWKTFDHNELMSGKYSLGALQNIFFDSRGLMWFVNNHSGTPALFCYNTSTDELKSWKYFENEDGTKVAVVYVRCVTEDKQGNIWVGTNVGPLMIKSANIPDNINEFVQVKVPRNDGTNYADYLLDGIDITSIAIDGGNRKWFGSNTSGLYLISEDNMEQLQHFTKDNSLLFSDKIESLAIQHNTGEVFIGTDKGLCSFMSDATEVAEEMTKDNVYAYPNPVRPDYTGLITITGLTYNASIKIVSSNGTLIREGRSNGGSFTWDGCDLDGKKVASGVYMVQTATAEGKKGTVCKVAIVR